MTPSNHYGNCQARASEIEDNAGLHPYEPDKYRAMAYREAAAVYSKLADTENRERIREQQEHQREMQQAKTVSHAIDVLRSTVLADFYPGKIMALVEILGDVIAEVEPSFYGDRIMVDLSTDLRASLKEAETRIETADGDSPAEKLAAFDKTEATAQNFGMPSMGGR